MVLNPVSCKKMSVIAGTLLYKGDFGAVAFIFCLFFVPLWGIRVIKKSRYIYGIGRWLGCGVWRNDAFQRCFVCD
jgi:hypothetical protein